MPFGDKDALIRKIHASLNDDQGLIEVESGVAPRGYEYIYSIIKTYHQDELNVNYCLRLDLKNGNEIIEALATYFEAGTTGMRSAMGWNMAMSAGFEQDDESPHRIKGWAQDPYDPDYKKGCRMILAERAGLDGLFPDDPLSQVRELVLALTEDSYYKTREEIDKEHEKEKSSKKTLKRGKKSGEGEDDKGQDSEDSDQKEFLQRLFSNDVVRSGAYKVSIGESSERKPEGKRHSLNPADVAKAATNAVNGVKSATVRTLAERDKVRTPFEIPDNFRNKLNQPVPKELPGWGKREYIGFGKGTFAMSGIMLSWPVTEQESLPLSGTENLVRQFHSDMDDNQGLISAKCGITPKGNRYAYVIRKMRFLDDEGNQNGPTDYELNFNIRIKGKIHFINGSFQSRDRVPGKRAGMLYLMSLGSSEIKLQAEQWTRDPYDPDREKGFLMDWTEDEKYDGLFPYHPLSELRKFVRFVIENN